MPRITELPWFPFWARDFRDSTQVRMMPPACVGIYILMLTRQWTDGPLSSDPADIARLFGFSLSDVQEQWPRLLKCFDVTDSGLLNLRLEEERWKQERKRELLSAAGKRGGRPPKKARLKGGLKEAKARLKPGLSSQSQIQKLPLDSVSEAEDGNGGLDWERIPDA